jgi:hypothetical protein
MANHTCPSRPVENNNVKLTHNWGQPPRKPPECEHMQSALKRRKALSFLTNQHISKFSNISTRVNAKMKIKHLKTQVRGEHSFGLMQIQKNANHILYQPKGVPSSSHNFSGSGGMRVYIKLRYCEKANKFDIAVAFSENLNFYVKNAASDTPGILYEANIQTIA